MATLLLWLSWRDAEPEPAVWAGLRSRASARSVYAGEECAGAGYRIYVARSRELEPAPLLRRCAADGTPEILLLDRAVGANDGPQRDRLEWLGPGLFDGTPTAALRLNCATLALELYRDPMGQRALVYARIAGGLLVASGEDVLRAHPAVGAELDCLYLAAFFAGLAPAHEETVYRDIRSVASGERLQVRADGQSSRRAHLEPDESWASLRDVAIVDRFRALFEQAVAHACRGARRVGISLSAGLDSSSIAAVASRIAHAPGAAVVGVTQGLPDFPNIDERAMAGQLAHVLGLEFRSFAADPLLPYADPDLRPVCPDGPQQSPYREWKESSARLMAAAGVDLWLDGGFADDLFSGGVEWVVDTLRFRRWRLLAAQLTYHCRQQGLRALLRDTAIRRPLSRLLGRVGARSTRLLWLRPEYSEPIAERLDAEARRYRHFPRPLQCLRLLGASAALDASAEQWFVRRHGLEQRLPFRDLALTRWCLSVPADFSVRNGQSKWMLREAMRGALPDGLRLRAKSSDLTPVFERAMRKQAQALARLRAIAEPWQTELLAPSAIPAMDSADRLVSDWLAAAFGAWKRAQNPA